MTSLDAAPDPARHSGSNASGADGSPRNQQSSLTHQCVGRKQLHSSTTACRNDMASRTTPFDDRQRIKPLKPVPSVRFKKEFDRNQICLQSACSLIDTHGELSVAVCKVAHVRLHKSTGQRQRRQGIRLPPRVHSGSNETPASSRLVTMKGPTFALPVRPCQPVGTKRVDLANQATAACAN